MGLARVNTSAVVVTGGTMAAGPELLTLEQLGMYSAKYERGEIDEAISKDPNFSLDRREISGLLLFQESRTIFSKKEPQKVPPDKKTSWGKRETV